MMEGGEETIATEQFVMMMDRFFDAFNVRDLSEGKKTRKTIRAPYWSEKDWRFEVCEFVLHYLYVTSVKRTN